MSDIKITDLFEYSNAMAAWVKSNPMAYQSYLKIAAHTQEFTEANKLLIQGFMQNKPPMYLANESDWKSAGYVIDSNATPVYVMEHAPEKRYGYVVRKTYDISAVNAEYEYPSYDKGFVLDAMLLNAPCNIEYVDNLQTKAMYNPDKNVIQMTKGFKSFEEIFFTLSQEYTHCTLYQQMETLSRREENNSPIKLKYTRGANIFTAFSVAYTLSEKYNMLPGNISIKSLPESWLHMDPMNFKKELTIIDNVFDSVEKGMSEKLNELYKGDEAVVS